MKKKFTVLALLVPLFLIGCSTDEVSISSNSISNDSFNSENESSNDDSVSNSSESTVAVKSVSLNQSSLQIYSDDLDATLTANISPEDASNKEVTWTSSNTSVLTVSEGKITPVGVGTAKITVTTVDGNKKSSCNVTIKAVSTIPNYVMHGQYDSDTDWTDKQMVFNSYKTSEYMLLGVSLSAGDIFKIHMYGDEWYGYSAVKSMCRSLVYDVGTDDNIEIRNTGVYDIYCDANETDGGHIYIARTDTSPSYDPVTVPVQGIILDHTGKYVKTRAPSFKLNATIYPSNATNKDIYWSSSDTSIATVSNGTVSLPHAGNTGSTTITAKTADGNFTATCIVYATASNYPDYYLYGTINGYSVSSASYTKYPAIPISSKTYLIPDVVLVKGDVVQFSDSRFTTLKQGTTPYKYTVNEYKSVNIYLTADGSQFKSVRYEAKSSS